MKKCKTFYEAQTATCFKEIIQPRLNPLPTRQNITISLEQKFSYADIQKHIRTFAFKVLQECSN